MEWERSYFKRANIPNPKKNFKKYGFDPLDTSCFEPMDVLTLKGGEDIRKEIFSVKNQANQDIGLRFDHTVPLARYIASHPELKLPFKRYTVGPVFRDGPAQVSQGRYTQFTQCDADIVGIKDMSAEAELIGLAKDAFRDLGLGGIEIKINNRKVLNGILHAYGIPKELNTGIIRILDKLDKTDIGTIKKQLLEFNSEEQSKFISNDTLMDIKKEYEKKGKTCLENKDLKDRIIEDVGINSLAEINEIVSSDDDFPFIFSALSEYRPKKKFRLDSEKVESLLETLVSKDDNPRKIKLISSIIDKNDLEANEGLGELLTLFDYVNEIGYDSIIFDPALARGLDYYTGTILEIFLKDKSIIKSALLGGGRYDKMISQYAETDEDIPAIGFSFGLERLVRSIKESGQKIKPTYTDVYLISVGDTMKETLKLAKLFRDNGIHVDVSPGTGQKIGKQIAYADDKGIKYVVFLGETEIKNNTVSLKNLETGNQELLDYEAAIAILKENY